MASEGASGAASGGQLEEKVDLTAECDAKIPQAESLAESGQLQQALALLAGLEKKCRVGNDNASLARVCETSLQLCKDAADDEALVATLQTLATRRSQKTAAVRALVNKAIPWCLSEGYMPLEVPANQIEARDKLVVALREITDGKIFLEAERARLTRALATIKEQEGDVAAAADILQEVHVETYGSLSKKEKVEFILEQMRLTLAKQDYVRAAIVAGKVSRKYLLEESVEEYKVRFYTLLAEYHRHEKDALELAKDFYAIYSTPTILKDDAKWKEALQSAVLFLALSPYGNEQQDMMNRITADPLLEQLPSSQALIQLMLKQEIINYPLVHQAEIESWPAFAVGDLAQHWKEIFHRRIIQHNIRVVSKYYKRIHGARLAQLLGLPVDRLEEEISMMVSDGSVYAKIDRPKDIVRFSAAQMPEAVLTSWAADIDKLLDLVESTTQLIQKENMTQ
jgi:26S proteasome regulatory subunit N5